jgi:small GTP-binding protein
MIFKWKVSILGDPSVGKTSLVRHYCDGYFRENYLSTIGVSFLRKELTINNNTITLQLWDLGGQSIFGGQLRENYLRGSHGALILFDLTAPASFAHVQQWYDEVMSACQKIPVIIIGNKSDLPFKEKISEKAEKLCNSFGSPFYKTSAKTGDQMEQVFQKITELIMNESKINQNSQDSESPIQEAKK